MARRSDHSRPQLRELILAEAHRQMAEVGFARFSAREVAKRVGYSIGTLYNVFPSLDGLLIAVNTRTFGLWADALQETLDHDPADRLAALVEAYFDFAHSHPALWLAIYQHVLPADMRLSEDDDALRGRLTGIVVREVAAALPETGRGEAPELTASLLATVHGHCRYDLDGAFRLMGHGDAVASAIARVREAIAFRTRLL